MALEGPKAPNISNLANSINTSRATVMNYIKNLADARLINIVYPLGQSFPKKPAKVMLHNTNLVHAIYPVQCDRQELMEIFLLIIFGHIILLTRVRKWVLILWMRIRSLEYAMRKAQR